jgi:hypothetical protein
MVHLSITMEFHMKKITLSPIRKMALVQILLIFPVIILTDPDILGTCCILLAAFGYCFISVLYGFNLNIQKPTQPYKFSPVGNLTDPYMGLGTSFQRKRVHGF